MNLDIIKIQLDKSRYADIFEHLIENLLDNESSERVYYYIDNYYNSKSSKKNNSQIYSLKNTFLETDFLDREIGQKCIQEIKNYLNYLPEYELIIKKGEKIVFQSYLITEIWEDDTLPYFYILHDGINQNYILLEKENSQILPFNFHDICKTVEKNCIIGRHNGYYLKYDFCELKYTSTIYNNKENSFLNPVIEEIEGVTNIKSCENYETIIPIKTNIPYYYIPLKNINDLVFFNKLENIKMKGVEEEQIEEKYSDNNELPF